jgi:HlyD family secretion protein
MNIILSHLKARKKLLIIPLAILVFLLIRTVLLQKPNTELTYTVHKENLVDTVQVSGTYTTASQTQVASPTTGIISKLYVKNGDIVKKGAPLFHVESTATPAQQKAAQANYLAASAAVQADKATLYSLQSAMYSAWQKYTDVATNSTFENDDGSPNSSNRTMTEFTTVQNDWYAAEAKFKNQQSVIAKSEAALSSAKQLYDETQSLTVTAPTGGTVANFLAHKGDQVAAGFISQTTGLPTAPPVLVVTNDGDPTLTADVSQDYAVRITPGQKTTIVFDALKNEEFTGRVEDIATVGLTTKGTVTYTTRITPQNVSPKIKSNMTALLTIETLRKNDVFAVPNSAVVTEDGQTYVLRANNHKKLPVKVGLKGLTKTEIVEGLSTGTNIVTNPE